MLADRTALRLVPRPHVVKRENQPCSVAHAHATNKWRRERGGEERKNTIGFCATIMLIYRKDWGSHGIPKPVPLDAACL